MNRTYYEVIEPQHYKGAKEMLIKMFTCNGLDMVLINSFEELAAIANEYDRWEIVRNGK